MKSVVTRYNKLLVALISVLTLASFLSTSASADYFSGSRTNNAKPYAWYDASVANYGYTSHYDAGRAYWNSHSKVDIKRSLFYDLSYDKYYIGNTSTSGLLGRISPKTSSGAEAGVDSFWSYVVVTMYDNQMRAQSNYSSSYIRMNAAHEIGHSIKMAHAAKAYNSVMPQGWRPIPSSLTIYDSGEVGKKWPL